jgi:hypothetical protein
VTLFLSRLGPTYLPYLYIALGGSEPGRGLGYGVGLGNCHAVRSSSGCCSAFAGTLVVLRLSLASGAPLAFGVIGVAINVVNTIMLTLVWTIAATALDARQAKRLFPAVHERGHRGRVRRDAGGRSTDRGDRPGEPRAGRRRVDRAWRSVRGPHRYAGDAHGPGADGRPAVTSAVAQLRAGFDDVRRSPLLRLVAIAYVLFSILMFSVQFPYQTAIADTFGDDDAALATFVGSCRPGSRQSRSSCRSRSQIGSSPASGWSAAALVLPIVYVLGFGTWLIQFTLATAVAVSFSQQVVQRSISNAAWSALYTVVPSERRPQVLAFMDGVPGQLGVSLSGVLLLAAGVIAATSLMPVFVPRACDRPDLHVGRGARPASLWRGAGADAAGRPRRTGPRRRSGAGLDGPRPGGGGRAHRGHRRPDAGCPRDGRRPPRPPGRPGQRGRHRTAARRRRRGGPRVRRCGRWGQLRPEAVDALAARLAEDPAPAVRAELAVALAGAGEAARADELLDGLLGAADPVERATGLGRWPHEPGARTWPSEPRTAWPTGRHGCVQRRRRHSRQRSTPRAPTSRRRSRSSSPRSMTTPWPFGARPPRRSPVHDLAAAAMVEVLSSGSERAQEAAVRGLEGTGTEMIEPVRAWAHERIARVTRLRVHAAALQPADPSAIGAPDRASIEFLCGLIGRRERRTEAQLLTAIATLGAPEATGLLRRSLRAPDPDVRAQAIEALDALGDRQLGREVVGLFDTDVLTGNEATDEALRSLGDDPDPWIRSLALRAIGDRMTAAYRELIEDAANDPDAIVRATAATMPLIGGRPVTETARTLDELERMVVLRRVPLFSELDPEDLQRIAVSAAERLYPAGEPLVREGDVGDELIVIVSGTVSISKKEGRFGALRTDL